MLEYPEIPGASGQSFRAFEAHVFDKLDGCNLRFDWNYKRAGRSRSVDRGGWFRYGTRHRLFDETDPMFGPAVEIFHETLGFRLSRIAQKLSFQLTVFCEFWSPDSLGGLYTPGEGDRLTVIDASKDGKTLMDPKEFIKVFKNVPTPNYLGKFKWTRGFVQDVWEGKVEGITREGVVGKMDSRRTGRVMAKAKTKEWVEAIRSRRPDEAEKLINS